MGYRVSLDRACAGSGVVSKLKSVTLKDGRTVSISGAEAPLLWDAGEDQAVLAYLREDVQSLMRLAVDWERTKRARWFTKQNKLKTLSLITPNGEDPVLTVDYCSELPLPDTSWMTNPPSREAMVGWLYK